tara:strand:- start:7390 stop:8460 length:1071 start_codon:yes stop_codon:yes gene_type:complete
MATFHSLKIKDISKQTPDCSVITFDMPEDLSQVFDYTQGQHLTLKAIIDGQDTRRSYSLCSSMVDKQWQVAVKKIPGGVFSSYVNDVLQTGDTLQVMPPSGKFGVPISTQEKTYIAFVAGSGITPVLSMIKTHLAKEPKARFKLFYLNRTVKSIIFKEQIEQLRNQYFGRLEIFYFLTKEHRDAALFNGRFTDEKLKEIFQKLVHVPALDEAFVCGPEEMIFLVQKALITAGMPQENIHYELFVSGLSKQDKKRASRLQKQSISGVEVTIVDGGKEFHFTMTDQFDNILDAALDAGADLPYACKGGVCSTCKCEVLDGTLEMKINYALNDKEVSQNLVLSCQAVPTTDKVKVDFDV